MQTIKDKVSAEDRKKLNVLTDNETRRDRMWKDAVEGAKTLLKESDEIRYKVVALTRKVCVIHYGGRAVGGRYTVDKFAKEIGMARGTLHEWIRMVKVSETISAETGQKKEDIKISDIRLVDANIRSKVVNRNDKNFSKIVASTYKEIVNKSESTIKMMKYINHMNSVVFNVKNKAMIRDVEKEVLAEILHAATEIVKHLKYIDTEVIVRKNDRRENTNANK